MSMTDKARSYYEDTMTDTERESVRTLVAEGKHQRARDVIRESALAQDIELEKSEAEAILNEFTTDLPADEATEAQFPEKINKPDMGLDMHESISDPDSRRAPNPSDLNTPTQDD